MVNWKLYVEMTVLWKNIVLCLILLRFLFRRFILSLYTQLNMYLQVDNCMFNIN